MHLAVEAPRCLAARQCVHERQQAGGIFRVKHGFDRSVANGGVFMCFGNSPAGRQTDFESEAAGQLGEEAVERTDAQPVQTARGGSQHGQAFVAIERLVVQRCLQLGQLRVVGRRLGQSQQDAARDFAGRFTRESRCQDVVGLLSEAQQA